MRRYFTNKFWIALIGSVLILSAIVALALGRVPVKNANVYQDGVLVAAFTLSDYDEPYFYTAKNVTGTNIIRVEQGRICIAEANCPDGLCVRQGWASSGVTPIVCLPHGLVITLINRASSDVDAIVG